LSGGAAFSNGRTAERFTASLRLTEHGLEIRDRTDGLLLAMWRADDLVPLQPAGPGSMRLSCRIDADARLTIDDPVVISQLVRVAPALAPRKRRFPPLVTWAAALIGAVAGVVLLYEVLLWLPRPLARAIPFRWEASLGNGLVAPLIGQLGGECKGHAGQVALESLAHRLGQTSGSSIPFRLHAVKAAAVNAFALPGGQIVLLNGLLKQAGSADELAAVVAHEMSHVILRHVAEQTIRGIGLGWTVLMITGEPTSVSAVVVGTVLRLSYSRQAEAEADAMGADLLRKADVSTQAMNDFFARLARRHGSGGSLPDFLSDHPPLDTRGVAAPPQPFTRPALSDKEWQSLRAICD
jgi:Zn-dependent protease with chaperone function